MSNVRQQIRKINSENSNLPRLVVIRSNNHISAQIIDDKNGAVLASASSLKLKKDKLSILAVEVGSMIAKKALDIKIGSVVLDRSKYKFHGAVRALTESAKKTGLKI